MLTITDLTLRIAGRTLIEHADVALPEGARVGIVGRNGTGKTTLFKAIAGDIHPDGGSLRLPKGARFGRVAQEAPSGPESLLETVLAADTERSRLMAESETATDAGRIAEIQMRLVDIDAHSAPSRAARILAGLGFDAEAQARPCSSFSGGWRMRVALAAVLFSEPDLLLLDEPTNHLDLEGTLWLQDYLARYPRTVLVISHDRDLLDASVDHILHMTDRKLTLYRGNFTSFDRQRREKLLLDTKAKKKQDEERAHLEAFVARFKAKASKARQAQSRVKRLEKMETITVNIDPDVPKFDIPKFAKPLAPPMIALDNAGAGYGERVVIDRMMLSVAPDDRIGLLGANGNGKSTLSRLLAGDLAPMRGEMRRSERMVVGYFAQHTLEGLIVTDTPVQHVRARMRDAAEAQVRARTARIGFSGERADVPVKNLSGGEKARLAMGLAVFEGPHLLILDEPTNHLDIDSRAALVEALNDFAGAVVLVSHDRHLLDACAERLWLVEAGRVEEFGGDLDDYRTRILRTARGDDRNGGLDESPADRAAARRAAAELRQRLAPLRQRISGAEKLMAKLEKEIAACDRDLADGDVFTRDPARGETISKRRASAVAQLQAAEADWMEASEAMEAAQP